MRTRAILALIAAQLLLAGAAQATTLYTAPLARNGGQLFCLVTNASPAELAVEIRIMRDDGGYVGGYTATLAPSATAYSSSIGDSYDHCEFKLSGNAKRVRAMACTGPSGGPCYATAPAY
jgi:hypothetical protein